MKKRTLTFSPNLDGQSCCQVKISLNKDAFFLIYDHMNSVFLCFQLIGIIINSLSAQLFKKEKFGDFRFCSIVSRHYIELFVSMFTGL